MSKNIHNFEIYKTETRDWYLASDVDKRIRLLWARIDRLTKTINKLKKDQKE